MAKKQNYYYVLVFTGSGPAYVTSVDYRNKTARWDKLEKPLELGQSSAKDLCFGLNCNFTSAVVVCMPTEIEYQPYRYDAFELEFKEIENK